MSDTNRDKIMKIYATEGASAAAVAAGVSKRTVQRWAAAAKVGSGYVPPIRRECPSAASYARGCHCDGCTLANREAQREIKARRVERFQQGLVKIVHGVSGYANWECRCPVCKSAWSKYLRDRRAASLDN